MGLVFEAFQLMFVHVSWYPSWELLELHKMM